jgi:phosphopantothenoylcysteine decarboxylase/phosphopantothenate--cysteine ligase
MAQILLGCGASAALHKACDLASKLAQEGHRVRVLLTPRAAELVAPQLFEALTGERAQAGEFGAARSGGMDHIELARFAELFLVAPATADLVAKLAHGMADDLVTTTALALSPAVPRLISPAMNPHMLSAPPVVRNLERLRADGWRVLAAGSGRLACGDAGQGRLPEVETLLAAVAESLS